MGGTVLAVYIIACCSLASGYVSFSWRWHLFVWRLWRDDPQGEKVVGIFRNDRASRGYPSFKPGGRWGFFHRWIRDRQSRDSRDPFGCWMKDRGIWPW